MFLNIAAAKKLFKRAFNGHGLRVAIHEERLYIAGLGWEIENEQWYRSI